MMTLRSALLGVAALTIAGFGVAPPAQAHDTFGIYLNPNGYDAGVDRYRDYCRDYRYRHRYPNFCSRYYDDNDGDDYNNAPYFNDRYYDNDDRRYRHRHRDSWDRQYDDGGEGDRHYRDGNGGERHGDDGGEGE